VFVKQRIEFRTFTTQGEHLSKYVVGRMSSEFTKRDDRVNGAMFSSPVAARSSFHLAPSLRATPRRSKVRTTTLDRENSVSNTGARDVKKVDAH
jgi:hypothetical protein